MEIRRVPPGWTATQEAYVANDEAMRTVYAAIRTYREERDVWERAYYELSEESELFQSDIEARIAELERDIAEERAAWTTAIRKAKSPGFGVFVGPAWSGDGVELAVGLGIVWKMF